jgi:cytochrome d ubiquinol oxidase subunit I
LQFKKRRPPKPFRWLLRRLPRAGVQQKKCPKGNEDRKKNQRFWHERKFTNIIAIMDTLLLLSRLQFAVTTVYHFLFVPLTIGLGLMVAVLETIAWRNASEEYTRLAQFWGKLFLINFAVGVVTGIVQEFQFGMNWSEYSRFVGDVFGAPLAIEALLAFFLESTFLGVWIFGRGKIPAGLHLASIWIVAAASLCSAVWILIANSFMQHPVGYEFVNGRAQMTDFGALVTNPYFLHQFPHVFFASLATAAFVMTGVSAWQMRKKVADAPLFQKSFRFALWFALVASVGVALTGHIQGGKIAQEQPMKLAAMEALEETADPAPLSVVPGVEIPGLLSFMVHNQFEGEVRGMNDLQAEYESKYGPGDYKPNTGVAYWSFRAMVGAGTAMVGLCLLSLFWRFVRRKEMPSWMMVLFALATLLPYLANSTGWLVAEMGRQPWVVYNLMQTKDAVSALTSSQVLFSLGAFTLLYAAILGAMLYLFHLEIKAGFTPTALKKKTQQMEAL